MGKNMIELQTEGKQVAILSDTDLLLAARDPSGIPDDAVIEWGDVKTLIQALTDTLYVPVGRTLTTTSPIRIGGGASADLSADRTLSILAATTGAAGSMSAADKAKLDGYVAIASYTPTVTAQSGTFTTVSTSGKYAVFGSLVWYTATVVITNHGTAGGEMKVTIPFTATANSVGTGREDTATGAMLQSVINPSTDYARVVTYAGGSMIASGRSAIISGWFTK